MTEDDKLVRVSDVKDLFHQGDEKTFPFSAPGLVTERDIDSIPAVDAVPWEFLERYADWFCAAVSMPEFIREAKAFYKSINEAMKGGHIDG